MEQDTTRRGRRYLPVICSKCGREEVVAYRGADRVLIYCERCGARIFAYYTADRRDQGSEPPPEDDAHIIRQVEQELLRSVSLAAAALYMYLRRYMRWRGYAPTLREMQAQFGWRSPNAVTHYLKQLEEAGLIERDYGEPRGIRLLHVA